MNLFYWLFIFYYKHNLLLVEMQISLNYKSIQKLSPDKISLRKYKPKVYFKITIDCVDLREIYSATWLFEWRTGIIKW